MVADLGPVNSRGVEKFALEKEHVMAESAVRFAPMIRYLDVGFHNFVPQTFQYRAAILEGRYADWGIWVSMRVYN